MTRLLRTLTFTCAVLLLNKGESRRSNPFAKSQPSDQFTVSDVNAVVYGICTHGEVSKAAQICESNFFKSLIQNPHSIKCSQHYIAMDQCISAKWDSCFYNMTMARPRMSSEKIVSISNFYSESVYCNDGALSLPRPRQPFTYCLPEYRTEAKECVRRYRNLFRKNPAHPQLCERYSSAQSCLFRKKEELCEYDVLLGAAMKAMKELYRCWNPFCVWRKMSTWPAESSFPLTLQTNEDSQKSGTVRGIPESCAVNTASAAETVTATAIAASRVMNSGRTKEVCLLILFLSAAQSTFCNFFNLLY